jgi:hypothetical protein
MQREEGERATATTRVERVARLVTYDGHALP